MVTEIVFPPILETHAVELTPMEENEIDVVVISIFVSNIDSKADFPLNTKLYESLDGGTTWKEIQTVSQRAAIGWVTAQLGSSNVVKGQWDMVNTCQVQFYHDGHTIQNYAPGDPDIRNNLLLIGNEAVIPAVVQADGNRTYTLSKFSRGRRDTTMDTQPRGSRAIALRQPGRIAHQIPVSEVGIERRYKAIPPGGDLAAAVEAVITPTGKSYRPLWVQGVKCTRHVPSTNDWTCKPTISTRSVRPDLLSLLGFADPDPYDWHVKVSSAIPGVGVVDEFYVYDSDTFVYTAAQQTASLGAPVSIFQGYIARLNRHGVPGQAVTFNSLF